MSIARLSEEDSFGPFFSRFLGSHLWRGETFYLQIDAHSDFRQGWDSALVAMMKATTSYPERRHLQLSGGGHTKLQGGLAAARCHQGRRDSAGTVLVHL